MFKNLMKTMIKVVKKGMMILISHQKIKNITRWIYYKNSVVKKHNN